MYSETAIKTKAENSGNRLTRKQKAEIYDNALQQVKNGQVDTQTIEAALGGEEYSTYKNVLNNYEVLQQELNEIQAVDNKVKTQEQATREIEIKNELERIKTKANKLKNILQNNVTEKIDIDNIHLKTRESYLWDSYIGNLPNFSKNNLNNVKTSQKIDYDVFVEGLWDDAENTIKSNRSNSVENSQLESVENIGESGIIEKTVDNDVGVPGVYTDKIVWGIFKNHPVRKFGKGYYGKRIKQRISRVDNYELKINPNNESYYLQHPDGRYVQFENMVDNVLQDGKCVLNKKRSFYHVHDCGYKAQNRVLEQARRQIETANVVGYKVEWLVSDEKAVEQISRFFKENKINITVKFYPE